MKRKIKLYLCVVSNEIFSSLYGCTYIYPRLVFMNYVSIFDLSIIVRNDLISVLEFSIKSHYKNIIVSK